MKPCAVSDRHVDLWHASFCDLSDLLPKMEAVLSEDERQRAARYKFREDRQKFILARGLLRHIAGLYLGEPAQSLEFGYTPHGKPFLNAPLTFNVSHSGEMVLLAFSRSRRLGVDIERINWEMDVLEVAEGFFSEHEVQALRSLDGLERQKAFFRCWARKEAFLKGLGDGLSLPLGDFDVTVHPAEPPQLVRVAWESEAPRRWHLRDISIDPNYMATIAVEGDLFEVALRPASEALALARQ